MIAEHDNGVSLVHVGKPADKILKGLIALSYKRQEIVDGFVVFD